MTWLRPARHLPELALVVGGLVGALRVIGAGASLGGMWLPFGLSSIDPLDALAAGFALGAVAIGIRRRKRLAWPLAIAMFAAALVGQGLVLRHPIAAALALACLAVLVVDVGRYRAGTDRRMRLAAIAIMTAGVGVLVVGSVLAGFAAAAPAGSPLDVLATWAIETLAFIDPTGFVSTGNAGAVLEVLEFAIGIAVLVAALAVLAADPDRPDAALLDRDRAIARRHASGALAPFQVGSQTLLYSDPEGRGVVAYGRAGRTAIVLGDPIGPPDAAWRAFSAFEARCAAGDVDVAVYQATEAGAAELARLGRRTFRVGEEAIIELGTWSLEGARRANLRHTVARAARGGVSVSWHPDGLDPGRMQLWGHQLAEVDRSWQKAHGPALRFTINPFDADALRDVGIAVALDASGAVQAFATFRRTAPGAWVLDLLRRRPTAIPGALEACLAAAATAMRDAGGVELSLGLVALSGLSCTAGPGEERILAWGRRAASRAYDVGGLRFFKEKFDPTWHPRFGAVEGWIGFSAFILALLRLHLDVGAVRAQSSPELVATGPIRRLLRRLRAGALG